MLGLSVRPSCAARGRGEQREDQQRKHRPPRERACPVAQPIERVIVCPLRLWGPLRGLFLTGSKASNYVIGQAIAGATRHGEGILGCLLPGIGVCGT
jgi:hypothetical protein